MQCVFHRDEYITNFCKSEKCLLPLCPVCVKLHSEEHARGDRFGVFELIDVCIDDAFQQMSQHCQKLQMCRQKIASVNQLRKSHESKMVEEIRLGKKKLFDEIEHEFIKFEEELNFIMDQKEKQMVALMLRVEELVEPACHDIQSTMLRLRQPQTCLEALIHYYYYRNQRLQDWNHIILSSNQKIKASCQGRVLQSNLNPESSSGIKNLISNFINIVTQSLPIPSYELPIITSSSKAKYISLERCHNNNLPKPPLGHYSRRVIS